MLFILSPFYHRRTSALFSMVWICSEKADIQENTLWADLAAFSNSGSDTKKKIWLLLKYTVLFMLASKLWIRFCSTRKMISLKNHCIC